MITPYELWTKKKPNLNYPWVWGCRAVVRLPSLKLKTLGERGNECIFIGYAEHSKAFMFFVIEPNESVSINSIIESRDDMFDENTFSSVPRPSLGILNGTEYIGGSVVPEEVTKEVVQQPKPELKKSKRNRTPMNFEPKFQLYLIEGIRDKVSNQHSYCFNVKDDPKTFDKAMKSQDVAFWKEAINDEMDSITGNNTWLQINLQKKTEVACISTIRLLIAMSLIHNLIIHQMDVKTAFLNGELDEEVYMNQPQGFIMLGNENKDMGEDDVILVSTPIDTSKKQMPNNGKLSKYTSNPGTQHCQAIQSVLMYLKKTMDYRLKYTGYPSVLEGYTDASWISNTEYNSSTSDWLLVNKCDSAATLAKAYSQMYNKKSRHLVFRHSMIRELITNGVVSIEFVGSQQNLADHLTKGLTRDLVIKSAEGMGLKSN
ncbi:zinc finger, CCHC-type containing protein [Tanacetum coccineum]